jgi:hypothetical protein
MPNALPLKHNERIFNFAWMVAREGRLESERRARINAKIEKECLVDEYQPKCS